MNTQQKILETIRANNRPATGKALAEQLAKAPPHWTGAKWETHAGHMARIGVPLPLAPIIP